MTPALHWVLLWFPRPVTSGISISRISISRKKEPVDQLFTLWVDLCIQRFLPNKYCGTDQLSVEFSDLKTENEGGKYNKNSRLSKLS